MKILCSGYHNPHYLTVTEHIERAITDLGHQLDVFDDRQHLIPGRLRRWIDFFDSFSHRRINRNFIKCALNGKPDIALVTGGHRINVGSLQALKAAHVQSVLWTTDAPIHFEPILSAAPFYDYIFCQGTEAIELMSEAGIRNARWLPMACDPSIHGKVRLSAEEQECYRNDIVFVGSYHPNRAQIIKGLADFDIAIWGPGWEGHTRESSLKAWIKGSHTPTDTWVKLYSACKIILSIHYQELENRFPVYQASPRIFEALACGAFVISDFQKDVFTLFKDGEHLVGFKNLDELIEKIKYYLHHSEEREKIANCGRQEVLKKHKYVNRLEKLVSFVGQSQAQV
ncbi:MAG: glycosyltransferase [Desulfobacterales bacterium]